jgi:hypothetical protein
LVRYGFAGVCSMAREGIFADAIGQYISALGAVPLEAALGADCRYCGRQPAVRRRLSADERTFRAIGDP